MFRVLIVTVVLKLGVVCGVWVEGGVVWCI